MHDSKNYKGDEFPVSRPISKIYVVLHNGMVYLEYLKGDPPLLKIKIVIVDSYLSTEHGFRIRIYQFIT